MAKLTIFLIIFTTYFSISHGCSVVGITWPQPIPGSLLDTERGVILNMATTGIDGVESVSYGASISNRRYVEVNITDSRLVITTNPLFDDYEENETVQQMPLAVTFRCSDGSSPITYNVFINVVDTNNNAPRFLPSNEYVYTVAAPLPPGFEITGCLNDLIVRDIDLTTSRIDFAIEDNEFFEIEYGGPTTVPKNFQASLRTKTLIRSIPEPITLTITATDVDGTGNPPITTKATITIIGDREFEMPEEPVFSKAFYLADYTEDNRVVLQEIISLRSGYHSDVDFTIEGDLKENFEIVRNPELENQISIGVVIPLTGDVLDQPNVLLAVKAYREHTSGAAATVVIRLPQGIPLEFERAHYEGTIENDVLDVPQLILTQGYEGTVVSANVLNDYSSYFNADVQGNTITLSMTPLEEIIINENTFIYLQIVASTDRSITTTVVTLEIIKDDNITPVFNKPIYTGSYIPGADLSIEQISFTQGYDGIDSLDVFGDYSGYFAAKQEGASVRITVSTIPPELYSRGRIVLSLEATKPRTVGASSAVIITLPAARELGFEASTYRGSLQNNVLTLDPIPLTVGYDENIHFSVTGDYASNFRVSKEENRAIIRLETPLPNDVILENNIVILTLAASGLNAVTTTTSVLLDIIKDDSTTPVFSRNIYYGTYLGTSNINIDDIILTQGYDSSVTFRLDGDHAEYFDVSNTGNRVEIVQLSSIPDDVIYNEKVLVFNVLALKALTVGANAAVSIRFPSELTDPVVMRFAQNTYTATIDNNGLTADYIVLSTGYGPGTQFVHTGEYSSYFTITPNDNRVTLSLLNPLPTDTIENSFIVLEIQASREGAVSGSTSIVVDIQEEIVPPKFTQPYYRGVYDPESGLQFNEVISLLYGHDDTVAFDLDGGFASLFTLVELDSKSLSIEALAPISEEVLKDNSHLLFTVVATKPGSYTARATISIDIVKESSQGPTLGFDRVTYLGTIQNDVAHVGPITIIQGYTDDVTLALYGDLATYFTPRREGSVITVTMQTPIPTELIPDNRIIVLEIRASAPQANTAYATIVLEAILADDTTPTVQLAFDAPFYTGSYNTIDGLRMDTSIALTEAHDTNTHFALQGDNSQWFSVSPGANSVDIVVSSAIPEAVLASNRKFVFLIIAQRTGALPAQATIVISLTADESPQGPTLGFDRVTYLGTIQNDVAHVGPITIIQGYTDDITLALYGDLATYFTPRREGSVITVTMQTPIPTELIPDNRIIVLEIRASAPQANTAYATIVLEAILADDTTPTVQLAFDAPFYTGSYNTIDGLRLDTSIALTEAHDTNTHFALQGDNSQWFSVRPGANSVDIVVSSAIPEAVLASNRKFVFLIIAQRTGALPAQATIVISLTADESPQGPTLGFDRVTYLGTIQNDVAHVGPITIIQGYTDDITLALYGDLATYFTPRREGSVITVTMQTPIPTELIPDNRIIVLEIRASAPQANTAYATIVLEAILADDTTPTVQLAFDAPFYTGSYNTIDGLRLDTSIALTEAHDTNTHFALQGDNSQWFSVSPGANSVDIVVSSAIPEAVLASNRKFVFLIIAQRTGALPAQATIVISLTADESPQGPTLGFDRVTYLGTIQNDVAHVGPITIIQGYTDDITLALYGDLATYFTPRREGSVITVTMQTPIPTELIPDNRIIVLEIRASAPQANTAYATIVLEAILADDTTPTVQLAFDAPFYTGSYNTIDGLRLDTSIALTEAHDTNTHFALQGDNSQWFSVRPGANSVDIVVSSAIPEAVLASNRKFVFLIIAQRTGALPAQATIVISLTADESPQGPTLGFDRVTYLGTIQNDVAHVGPITIIQGYTDDITLALYGDLATYFTPRREGSVITVTMQTPIPTELIPDNRIIVLEIRASAPQANTAYATIVLEAILADDTTPTVQLAFDAPFYTGSYNTIDGLRLETSIALTEAHDTNTHFALQGDNSQWFSVRPGANSVDIVVSSAIPEAVLASNRKFVFLIIAQRTGALPAQATIVISLTADESPQGSTLGFDRVTYLGTIQNDVAHVGPITIIQGYTDDITLALYGDLATYFTPRREGSVITVTMQTPIPTELIPDNRIIVLEIRASAPQANTAYATIVLEAILADDTTPTVQLAFDAPFYTGSYNTIDGLRLDTSIALTEAHDTNTHFALQGDNSQWFSVRPGANSVDIVVSSAIPEAVLASNRKFVFLIIAQRTGALPAQATIVISLTADESPQGPTLGFDRVTYLGTIQNDVTHVGPITIIQGYTDDITLALYGDLATYFTPRREGSVITVTMQTPIPTELIPDNRIIVLEIRASAPQANTAYATIVLEAILADDTTPTVQLAFDAPFYTGSYNTIDGLRMDTSIALTEAHDTNTHFALQGDNSQWFSVSPGANSVDIVVSSAIPEAVLASNRKFVFLIIAQRTGALPAQATIVISLTADESPQGPTLGFDRVTYLGTIQNDVAHVGPITIIQGYTDDITLALYGDLATYFTPRREGSVITVTMQTPIPTELIPDNRIIVLEIRASAPQANTAYATIVLEAILADDTTPTVQLAFDAPFYTGSYNTIDGLRLDTSIALTEAHDTNTHFALQGDNSQWFSVRPGAKSVDIVVSSAIPEAVLASNRKFVFLIIAQRTGALPAQATIVISLTADESPQGPTLGFDRVTYLGTIQNDVAHVGPITIIQGYTDDITLALYGDLATYFTPRREGSVITVTMQTPIPTELIPDNRIIVLEIRASAPQANTAYATIVLEAILADDTTPTVQLAFDAPFYTGSYNTIDGLRLDTSIALTEAHDTNTHFALQGDNSQWFSVRPGANSVDIVVSSAIPEAVLASNRKFVFLIIAQRTGALPAQATIVISLTDDSPTENVAEFDKVYYEGVIQSNNVRHELVRISGYDGTIVDVAGAYSSLFMARASDGVVTVEASGTLNLPDDVTRVVLELRAAGARTAMVLNVEQSDGPVLPTVTFSSELYEVTIGVEQTGLVGQVSATADNGEEVTYSLGTVNAHLQTRLRINNEGELYLSAPANSGVYTFQVVATSVNTQATGAATVILAVEGDTVCEDNEIVVSPLIIINRDEEQAHRNLVELDPTQHSGCHYTMTNRWPTNENWLYVDEIGLHANVIDREHPSIAFMALSQVQVELILHCENDNPSRTKRSQRTDWLGPYDYGSNKWILTDTIRYNSRRSLVNLIVNDINDNDPIFVGKENEPIVVGYPTDDLEERILPRSLMELKATDADVGENAQLRYSSSESSLAVASTTGFVHVRSGASLQHDQILTVSATDRNGNGRTGTIQLMVKLLDLSHIVVVTVRDAFLDDETTVLNQLSEAVGYEVKALRSVVISDDIDGDVTRKRREANNGGASLQLYVYGLIEREPVVVDRLTTDISTNAAIVNVISTLTLEDHLEDITVFERDIGLLVATIVLSVLLFMLIVLIAIWFFLRWRKNKKYNELNEESSIVSRNSSLGEIPKPEPMKPRLNIEDLKRSEKRLQERLDAPIEEISVEPMTSRKLESPVEAILDMPVPEPSAPIVIQSIDKLKDADDDDDTDDEFGEVAAPRKSVVTFNENVEKIITVEDDAEDDDNGSQAGYEVYRL